MDKPFILDPCCGSKMFYHDKESDDVMFCDIRELHTKLCDGRELHIQPDKIIDVTNMENIADEAFRYIIFDPPHLVKVGESSWLAQKYGQLPVLWEEWMTKAFSECFRATNQTTLFCKAVAPECTISTLLHICCCECDRPCKRCENTPQKCGARERKKCNS